jgi:NAD(P)-dependent dehydrogenase (short-subunit alcohol dehydrogenase family)
MCVQALDLVDPQGCSRAGPTYHVACRQETRIMAHGPDTDPKDLGPQPPFPQETLPYPGLESEMMPPPDYGEDSYTGSGKLEGKVALITGGDSGIGRAVALAFAREGADVAISYLSEESDARETVRVVEAAGRKALAMAGDIQEEQHCLDLVDRTVSELGRLDSLVNNAAYQSTYQDIQDLPTEEWDRAFKTNIYAMFWLSRAALRHLPAGGAIINTTSIQSFQPSAQLIHYASTKGAITAFTMALSEAALKQGVRVNAVAPGPVWTPLIPATMPEQQVRTFGQDNPMGRPAQPAELAPAYVYLASDDSSFVSGQVVGVTGGKPLI